MANLVLLAAYNGEQYIEQQVESIVSSMGSGDHIAIRDDGSVDDSLNVIHQLVNFNEGRVSLVTNKSQAKGHVGNFSVLAKYALTTKYGYFCFADQDDVWHKNKLQVMNARMVELEAIHGKEMPILIHSDLRVVDENLNEIARCFVKYQGLPDPENHDFPKFFYQNVVTGCTTFFNRALLEIAAPVPKEAIVHDWWFAQCAKLFGVLDYIDVPLIDYRQHSENSIGAKCHKEQSSYFKKYIYQASMRFPKHLSKAVEQAKALNNLAQIHKSKVSAEKLTMLKEFANLRDLPAKKRIKWADIAINNHRAFNERWYFKCVFFVIKWIKP